MGWNDPKAARKWKIRRFSSLVLVPKKGTGHDAHEFFPHRMYRMGGYTSFSPSIGKRKAHFLHESSSYNISYNSLFAVLFLLTLSRCCCYQQSYSCRHDYSMICIYHKMSSSATMCSLIMLITACLPAVHMKSFLSQKFWDLYFVLFLANMLFDINLSFALLIFVRRRTLFTNLEPCAF